MATKEEFKAFARKHPELVHFIKSGEATWQRFFEIYDIYGEEESAWQDYFTKTNTSEANGNEYSFKSITDKIKNIDLSSIQEELTGKSSATTSSAAEVVKPRPINKIFED